MAETTVKSYLQGGEFLIKKSSPADTFIPEELNEEQLMIKAMVKDFVQNKIHANAQKIEKQEDNIASKLLTDMAELGLLGSHMPETYGGMELDNNTNTLIADSLGNEWFFWCSLRSTYRNWNVTNSIFRNRSSKRTVFTWIN